MMANWLANPPKTRAKLKMPMRVKYSETQIRNRYEKAYSEACALLSKLRVAHGREPKVKGLAGWVYEQTVRSCLAEELRAQGFKQLEFTEQVVLRGRAKIDFAFGNVAMEIKAGGFYGASGAEKYCKYRRIVEATGKSYLYVTAGEAYGPYVDLAIRIFGKNRAFFLDKAGEWARLVKTIAATLKQ
jgi:hypothetical protein